MKYVLTKGERRKQANLIYQFGLLVKLGIKFMILVESPINRMPRSVSLKK